MNEDEHQQQMDERRRREDEAIAHARKWAESRKRVLRAWFEAFDNRVKQHKLDLNRK